jgi:lipid A oxidase
LKNLRWDGEPFNFPIYAGVRAVRWWGPFGGMIDFLHDKAIARTGKGAHGRKVTGERAIPDTVEATGSLKGSPAPSPVKLTDILERLEFSHGHNMLMPTVLLRLGSFMPRLRPYVGLGAGVALPHVEVWPAGEGDAAKTNEYQAAGPAMQVIFGLEWKGTRGSSFLEYKFTYASLSTALTGGKTPAWCNCDIVSDFYRHIMSWLRGEQPPYGYLSTTLATQQVVVGAGYRLGSGGHAAKN